MHLHPVTLGAVIKLQFFGRLRKGPVVWYDHLHSFCVELGTEQATAESLTRLCAPNENVETLFR